MSSHLSLFDVLTGYLYEGQEVDRVDESSYIGLSVMSNLSRLFGTRQGTIDHLPDYGLPDITTIYRDIPDTIEKLRESIETAVRTYEPRLRDVKVDYEKGSRAQFRLTFIVKAKLAGRTPVAFKTTFTSTDLPSIERMS